MSASTLERDIMNRKIISVSTKRQITIPLQFYKHLNLGSEVECPPLKMELLSFVLCIENLVNFPLKYSKILFHKDIQVMRLVKHLEIQSKSIKKAVFKYVRRSRCNCSWRKESSYFRWYLWLGGLIMYEIPFSSQAERYFKKIREKLVKEAYKTAFLKLKRKSLYWSAKNVVI